MKTNMTAMISAQKEAGVLVENSLKPVLAPTTYKFENIKNSLEIELRPPAEVAAAPNQGTNFVLHQLIQQGNSEELYKQVANLLASGYQAVDKVASVLDYEGYAALHYTALQASVAAARLLLDQGVNLDIESKTGETPLHVSLRHGNVPLASLFMDRGANLKKVDSRGNNALHLAIERGLRGMAVKILMRSPFLVYSQNKTGYTALHYAAIQGDAQLCEKLISCEAKVYAKNMNGETPLHLASLLNHVDVIKILFEKGCEDVEFRNRYVNVQRNDNFTALHIAAKMGHMETVKLVLETGVKVNPCSPISHPLELASSDGHLDVMELFLSNGAIVDAKDRYGNTALHRAAMNDKVEAIKLLLSHGANVDSANEDGWTPLFFAVTRAQTEATALLLENGADSNKVDSKLCCCLHYAVKEDNCRIVMLLLQYGGDGLIFRRNINDRLILHEAVLCGNEKLLGNLLHRCSGTIIYCEDNKTLIHLAAEHGQYFCLETLIDFWPREYLDIQDNNGQTGLHFAAMNGHRYICKLLIESRAELNIRNMAGQKPMHLAITNRHNPLLQMLIDAKAEVLPEDTSIAINASNVDAVTMLLDFLASKYVGLANFQFNGLSVALAGNCEGAVEAIVNHYSFEEAIRCNNISLENVMPTMISKYPEVAVKVFDKAISLSSHPLDSKELEVTYDFVALEEAPSACNRLMGNDLYFAPALMAELNREDCLAHPLTQKLINLKWSSHGAYIFYLSFFLYLTFIISLTTLIILERNSDIKNILTGNATANATNASHAHSPSKSQSGQMLAFFIFIFLCITAVKELVQMLALRSRYLTELTNILEWTVLISAFGYLYAFLFMTSTSINTELLFGVCCLFFGWLNVLLFLRRSPLFNIYVVMFTQVILTLVRVLFVFTPLLLAFALAFNQLFVSQNVFKDIWNSYMKTFVMFSGELEYGETLPNSVGKKDESKSFHLVPLPSASYIIFALFIIMIPVALMNLLVGLAVGDIESIRESAKHNVMKQQARYIKDLREKLPKCVITWTYKRLHTDRPNAAHWLKKWLYLDTSTSAQLTAFLQGKLRDAEQGRDRAIEQKIDELKSLLEKQGCAMNTIRYVLDNHTRRLKAVKAQKKNS